MKAEGTVVTCFPEGTSDTKLQSDNWLPGWVLNAETLNYAEEYSVSSVTFIYIY
jgi:hypothetical protein